MNNTQEMQIAKLYKCTTILRQLQKVTNCPICLDPIEDSVRLECNHFLCANCFQGLLNEKPVRCPICRNELSRRSRTHENKIINAVGKFTTKAEERIKYVFSNIETTETSRITNCELLLDALEYKEPALLNFCKNLANKNSDEQPSSSSLNEYKKRHEKKDKDEQPSTSSFNKYKKRYEKKDKDEQPSTSSFNKNINKNAHKQLKNIDIKEPDPFDKLIGSNNERRLLVKKTYSRNKVDVNKSDFGAIDNKILEFEDSSTKVRIIEWLHDTQNVFDRMTQTQAQDIVDDNIENFSPDYFDMVSVSQLHKNKRLKSLPYKKIKKLNVNFESNACNKERSLVRAKSLNDIQKKETSPVAAQRHSLVNHNTCENYNIEESNTEEKDTLPQKAMLNILENQCLESIEREMLGQRESNSNITQEVVSKEETESLQKPATRTNKCLETTGWNRLKEIKRTIGKGKKGPKKLNITLQTTQCSKVSIDNTAASKNKEAKPVEMKKSNSLRQNLDYECQQTSKTPTVSKQSDNLESLQDSGDFYSKNNPIRTRKQRYNLKNLTQYLNNSTTENEEYNTVESEEDLAQGNFNLKERSTLSQQSMSKSTESKVSSNKPADGSEKACLLETNNQLEGSTKSSLNSDLNASRNLSSNIQKLTNTSEKKNEPSTLEKVDATSLDQVLITKQNISDVGNNGSHENRDVDDNSVILTQISYNHAVQNPTMYDDSLDEVYACPTQKITHPYCSSDLKYKIINNYVKNANVFINSLELMVNKYISTLQNSHPPLKSTLSLPSKTEEATSPSMSMFLNLVPELQQVYTSIDQLKEVISKIDSTINCNSENNTDIEVPRNSPMTNNVEANTQTDPCEDVIKCCKSIQTELKLTEKKKSRMRTKSQSQSSFYSCDSFTQTSTTRTCDKEIQTDAVSQAGFMISVSEAFKTQELAEKEIQTSVLECSKCRNSCFVPNMDENSKLEKSDELLKQSRDKEIKANHGRYSLTEFFDEINFDTQEALKTHAFKNKANSDAGVKISSQKKVEKSDSIGCENIENLKLNKNNVQVDSSENVTSNISCKRQAVVEKENLISEEKFTNISQAKKNKTSQESVLLCTFNDDSNKNILSASRSVSRRLNFSGAPNDINSSNKTYKRIRTNSPEVEQYPKRQCNRFIRDDISVVFETENVESTLPNDDKFQLAEGSGDVNYDEYLDRALSKKYVNNSGDNTNENIKKQNAGQKKTSEKVNSCNDSENFEPVPKRSRTQEVLDACKVLINEATKKHFNTPPQCDQDSSAPVQTVVVEKTQETVFVSPFKMTDFQGSEVKKSIRTVQLTGDLIFDEQNMSKIERDIQQHEKINTEFSDIIANTESDEKWLGGLKRPVSKSLKLGKVGPVNLPENKKDKFSESMFCGSGKMEESNTVNISAEVLDEFLNDMNVTMKELDDEADAEVERISLSFTTLANKPCLGEREMEVNGGGEENKDNASQISDEIFSDVDIVETTPEKTKQSDNRNSSKLKEKRNDDISISQEIAAIQDIPFSLDLTLPPPPGFQDTEDKENPEVIIVSDVTIKSNPTKTSSLTPDFINLSALMEQNENNKNNTTMYSQTLASEKVLSLSPIPVANKRQLNVIEISKQSKSSPLSITARPKPQRPALSITTSTPKQKSILPFVRQIKKPEEKVVDPSGESSSPKRKPCIACSRLNKKQVIAISSLTNKKLTVYSNTFGPDVTHMIVSVNEKNCLQDHTMKFVSAVAAGIWVLNFDWIQECLAKNCIVDEEPFEVLDVSGVPGPRMSRLRLSPPLLRGYKIHCAGPFLSTSKEEIEEVVRMLGGVVVTKMPDLLNKEGLHGLIITEAKATQDFDIYEEWLENFRVVTVDIEWLSRSVGQYHLLSLRPFALCSDDSLCDLGYPEELIVNEQYSFITPSA